MRCCDEDCIELFYWLQRRSTPQLRLPPSVTNLKTLESSAVPLSGQVRLVAKNCHDTIFECAGLGGYPSKLGSPGAFVYAINRKQ